MHPDFIEQPDGIDNNCDGNIDEEIEWIYGGVIQSDQSNSLFGMAVGSGDLNGDGYSDLIAAKKNILTVKLVKEHFMFITVLLQD